MSSLWHCPACSRAFTRKNQRHACGTGERDDVLRNRSPSIVQLYGAIEAFARSLGTIELVTRERYVLLRSVRIFADLVIGPDAIRIAIHLRRRVDHPLFFKVVSGPKSVTHVAKLRNDDELEALKPHLREAYEASITGP